MKNINKNNLLAFPVNFLLILIGITFVCIIGVFLLFSPTDFSKKDIRLINGSKTFKLNIELALSSSQQEKGLMNRQSLDEDKGMLFIFPVSKGQSFWMKDTYIPLDILFFDEKGVYLNASENTPPCINNEINCPSYFSSGNSKYVLELKGGWIKRNINNRDQNNVVLDISNL